MSIDLYNGLIEDLGAEDKDNYVYLDSEGRAQAKVDIGVKWSKLPKKQILLTMNAEYFI
jgi:hypothetical protein